MSKKRSSPARNGAGKTSSSAVRPAAESRLNTPVTLSFQFVEPGGTYCLSRCTGDEVREVMDCLRQLTTISWQQVLNTGGKGMNKAGLGCTRYPDSALSGVTRPAAVGQDPPLFGVRASQRFRIFGVLRDHVYFVLWFDRNHEIVRG